MDQAWYFTRGTEQAGPVDWAELKRLAANHHLTPQDSVWTAGFTEWASAATVPDLFTPADSTSPTSSVEIQSSAAAGAAAVPRIDYAAIAGPGRISFAGFRARVLASIVDSVLVLIAVVVLSIGFMWWVGNEAVRANAPMFVIFIKVLFVTVGWIYGAALESSASQGTFGKRLLGLKVTNMAGTQISFLRASVRHFTKFLSHALMIGILMMKFTPNNQCLHDMFAGCVVLKREWA